LTGVLYLFDSRFAFLAATLVAHDISCAKIHKRNQPSLGSRLTNLNGVFMKKNVLAMSIAAALIGLTGGAHAMTGVLNGATGTALTLNGDGVGHSLFIPYFSTQGGNATLINLVNTDQVRGKAVKIRFRGAANSDDIFDFQVFLSPGDVWAANISKDPTTGRSMLTTSDASCTKPAKAVLTTTPFITARLDIGKSTAEQLANGTREGYVEIFNMADIPALKAGAAAVADAVAATTAGFDAGASTANPLYTAIKHVKSVAPCSGAAWDNLDAADGVQQTMTWGAAPTSANAFGLLPPTTGLFANWTIINTVSAAAWSGEAVAVQATLAGVAAQGNVVYFPQTAVPVTAANLLSYTADPVFNPAKVGTLAAANVAAPVAAGQYDLPDMSTPYVAVSDLTGTPPANQAVALTASISAKTARNEYVTGVTAALSTDLVYGMPTRRYAVAYDYTGAGFIRQNALNLNYFNSMTDFVAPVDSVNVIAVTDTSSLGTNGNGRQICITGMSPAQWDREENTPAVVVGVPPVVISPSTPAVATVLSFCGEATVLSINNGGITGATGSLKASVAVKDIDVTYKEGWLTMTTPAADNALGLPIVGASYIKASSSATQSFGAASEHRFTR
jgi:hypothetical protein